MERLTFGEIVLLKFPFSDGKTYKKRPALVINDCNDGDIVVCRITSHIYESPFDVYLNNWEKYGLKLPSVVRIHKIATLDKNLVSMKIGQLNLSLKEEIKGIIAGLPE